MARRAGPVNNVNISLCFTSIANEQIFSAKTGASKDCRGPPSIRSAQHCQSRPRLAGLAAMSNIFSRKPIISSTLDRQERPTG